jgi:hypothetical protein
MQVLSKQVLFEKKKKQEKKTSLSPAFSDRRGPGGRRSGSKEGDGWE